MKNRSIHVRRVWAVCDINRWWDVLFLSDCRLFVSWLQIVVIGRLYILYCLCSSLVHNCFCEKSFLNGALALAEHFIITFHLLILKSLNYRLSALGQIDFFLVHYDSRSLDLLHIFFLFTDLQAFASFHGDCDVTFFLVVFVFYFGGIFRNSNSWSSFNFLCDDFLLDMKLLFGPSWIFFIDKILMIYFAIHKSILLAEVIFYCNIILRIW